MINHLAVIIIDKIGISDNNNNNYQECLALLLHLETHWKHHLLDQLLQQFSLLNQHNHSSNSINSSFPNKTSLLIDKLLLLLLRLNHSNHLSSRSNPADRSHSYHNIHNKISLIKINLLLFLHHLIYSRYLLSKFESYPFHIIQKLMIEMRQAAQTELDQQRREQNRHA